MRIKTDDIKAVARTLRSCLSEIRFFCAYSYLQAFSVAFGHEAVETLFRSVVKATKEKAR